MNRYKYIDEGRKHLHTLDEKPLIGTSTVAKESINKGDGLMQWYADLAAVCALGLPVQNILPEYEAAQLIQDWKQKKAAMSALDAKYPDFEKARHAAIAKRDASALVGTERHGVLEDYIRECIEAGEVIPTQQDHITNGISMFTDWAHQNVEQFYFTEAHCYSERLWLGGIGDIGMKLKTGQRVLGDHKSSKNAFFDQYVQCALYDIELSESGGLDRDGNKLFDWQPAEGYVVFPFRSTPFTPEFVWDVDEYRAVAEGVVRTYKLKQTLE